MLHLCLFNLFDFGAQVGELLVEREGFQESTLIWQVSGAVIIGEKLGVVLPE